MTVPYQVKTDFPKLSLDKIKSIFKQPIETAAVKHEMPTMQESYEWMKENIRPVEATPVEFTYEIDRLERELKFQKDSLSNYQNNVHAITNDYSRLEVDFRNSEYENRRLLERLDKLKGVESNNIYLMERHLEFTKMVNNLVEEGVLRSPWI